MKYHVIYLSSALKLEVETFERFENALARKAELNAQMIAVRLIHGEDLSTELAQTAHEKSLSLAQASGETLAEINEQAHVSDLTEADTTLEPQEASEEVVEDKKPTTVDTVPDTQE